jgi:3-oxoacyl-[acyl-carrier protein] reductase
MRIDLPPLRVVVAGGSRGIGRAIALAFARAGSDVSICARGVDALEATRAEIAQHGQRAHGAPCDLADAAAVDRYVAAAARALGGIDVLVNNASAFGFSDDDDADWTAGFTVDVMAAVRASRAALPWLERSSAASVIHITSISGLWISSNAAYGAAKAALQHYTRSQARRWAAKRIRVNGIAPGSTEFPGGLWADRRDAGDPSYLASRNSIPFGRMAEPEEVADVALFLASPLARWVTGQTIAVDGGQSL